MLAYCRAGFAMVLGFTLLTGIIMPLAMTGLAQLAFPFQANGSLVERDGRVTGSALIGQEFTADRYFQGRPSATTGPDPAAPGSTRPTPYNGAASAASQLGPSSAALLQAVQQRVQAHGPAPVPADAAYASGSGLDPHISPANAQRQVARIAAARGLPPDRLQALLAAHAEGPAFGLLGEARLNVLRLNLALDRLR